MKIFQQTLNPEKLDTFLALLPISESNIETA